MSRTIYKIIPAKQLEDGDGVTVYRTVGSRDQREYDPFLVVDDMKIEPDCGFFDHPHRGFIKIAYILRGLLHHEDFTGRRDEIEEGGLYAATAGKGIVHSESVTASTTGYHIWVNLPKHLKMTEPKVQVCSAKELPMQTKDGSTIKVVVGEYEGLKSPVLLETNTTILDITLQVKAKLRVNVPPQWNCVLYNYDGLVKIGETGSEQNLDKRFMVFFNQAGQFIEITNIHAEESRLLFLAGQAIADPLARRGPYIMCNEGELNQAAEDFENCENGFERAEDWKSKALQSYEQES